LSSVEDFSKASTVVRETIELQCILNLIPPNSRNEHDLSHYDWLRILKGVRGLISLSTVTVADILEKGIDYCTAKS
jgi:hypothetical protein